MSFQRHRTRNGWGVGVYAYFGTFGREYSLALGQWEFTVLLRGGKRR